MTDIKPNEFRCFACSRVFEKAWSEKEARDELDANYSGFAPDDCVMVCGDCYKAMRS